MTKIQAAIIVLTATWGIKQNKTAYFKWQERQTRV